MHLSRLKLQNYRSIRNIDLEIGDLQVLFGRNNVGKSNVLTAITDYKEMVPRGRTRSEWYSERVHRGAEGKEISFDLEFSLSEAEREQLFDDLMAEGGLTGRNASELRDLGFGWDIRHHFSVKRGTTISASLELNFKDEWIVVFDLRKSEDGRYEVRRTNLNEYPELPKSGVVSGDVDYPTSVLRDPFESLFRNTVDSWRWISPFRQPNSFGSIQEVYELRPESENLPSVLHTLANNRPGKFASIVDSYTQIMEGVSDIITPIRGSGDNTQAHIEIVEDLGTFDLKQISAGSKQILSLLTEIVYSADGTELLLIEEPETHLHPGAQRTVYQAIRDLVNDSETEVIVTTHSDVFVDETDSSQLVKVSREEGKSVTREIAPDRVSKELRGLGYEKSGLLQAKAVAFVEGRSDILILNELADTLGHSLSDDGVKIIDLEGEGNMKSDGQSLVKLLSAFGIPYVFILDSHENTPREERDELLSHINSPSGDWSVTPDNVFVWDRYGIESYLVEHPKAISDVLEVSTDEIESAIGYIDDNKNPVEVLDELFLSTLDRPYQKNSDGVLIARKIPSENISSEVKAAIDKIASLPN